MKTEFANPSVKSSLRRPPEASPRASEKRAAAFSNLGRRLSAARTPKEAARIIVDTADELFGWDACTFDLYSPKYSFTYDHVEVHRWYERAGLERITPVAPDSGVGYIATKPPVDALGWEVGG